MAPSSYATDQSQSHSTPLTAHTATNLRNHLAGTVHDAREKVAEQPFAHTPTATRPQKTYSLHFVSTDIAGYILPS